jgi:hypothetical protein
MVSSRTTQNAVLGAGLAGTVLLSLFTLLRNRWPDVMWPQEHDNAIIVYLTAVLGPLLARKIAFIRNPEKKK